MKKLILFLAANPNGTTQLALDKECREIEQKIRAADHRDSLEMITRWAVQPEDLLQYLNQHRPHIVHFSGHGTPEEEVVLLDRDGNPKPVSAKALKQLFKTLKDNIRVVVLNACFSRPQADAIVEVIDCAIGMNQSIGDEAAIAFAAAFYQGLGFGRSVKVSFESGKSRLMLDGIPEENTPELLVRVGVNPVEVFLFEPELMVAPPSLVPEPSESPVIPKASLTTTPVSPKLVVHAPAPVVEKRFNGGDWDTRSVFRGALLEYFLLLLAMVGAWITSAAFVKYVDSDLGILVKGPGSWAMLLKSAGPGVAAGMCVLAVASWVGRWLDIDFEADPVIVLAGTPPLCVVAGLFLSVALFLVGLIIGVAADVAGVAFHVTIHMWMQIAGGVAALGLIVVRWLGRVVFDDVGYGG